MTTEEANPEIAQFLHWLEHKHKRPATQEFTLSLEASERLSLPGERSTYAGLCNATPARANIRIAMHGRALHGLLAVLAHEYKHALQAASGCTLKKHGIAREKQADDFADRELYLYAKERVSGELTQDLRESFELAVMLYEVGVRRLAA
jgi:hypothetical protein